MLFYFGFFKAGGRVEQRHVCSGEYHSDKVNRAGAGILFMWFYQNDNYERKPDRIAPLCEFGGVAFVRGERSSEASGTFAVCSSSECSRVHYCGYSDGTGLGPTECFYCGTPFTNADYFQPVYGRKPEYDHFRILEGRQ